MVTKCLLEWVVLQALYDGTFRCQPPSQGTLYPASVLDMLLSCHVFFHHIKNGLAEVVVTDKTSQTKQCHNIRDRESKSIECCTRTRSKGIGIKGAIYLGSMKTRFNRLITRVCKG
jgi:hypothetical protein